MLEALALNVVGMHGPKKNPSIPEQMLLQGRTAYAAVKPFTILWYAKRFPGSSMILSSCALQPVSHCYWNESMTRQILCDPFSHKV